MKSLTHIALTRRQMMQGAAAVAATSALSGCTTLFTPYNTVSPVFGSNVGLGGTTVWEGGGNTPQPTPAGSSTNIAMSITMPPHNSGLKFPFRGLSYEKNSLSNPLFTAKNNALISLFNLIAPGVLRIGGASTDTSLWNATGKGQTAGEIAPADIDALAAFITATGWDVIYAVNLGGSATGVQTTALAAAEVTYVAKALGTSLAGIEIGNEPDLYGAAGSYYAGGWTLAQFETLWEQYRSAIVAAVPAVPISGPAVSTQSTWIVPFVTSRPTGELSFATQHYYRGDGLAATSTVTDLVSTDTGLAARLSQLGDLAAATGADCKLSEANSYYNGGAAGVSNTYASALWALDFIYTSRLGAVSGVNLHGGGSVSYTPIADNKGVVVEARPEFYGLIMAGIIGDGCPGLVTLNTALNVTAYVLRSGDAIDLLIVNKEAAQTLHATAILPVTVNSAALVQMVQTSDAPLPTSLAATTGITVQGATVDATGNFKANPAFTVPNTTNTVTFYAPPLSAVIVRIT